MIIYLCIIMHLKRRGGCDEWVTLEVKNSITISAFFSLRVKDRGMQLKASRYPPIPDNKCFESFCLSCFMFEVSLSVFLMVCNIILQSVSESFGPPNLLKKILRIFQSSILDKLLIVHSIILNLYRVGWLKKIILWSVPCHCHKILIIYFWRTLW